MMLDTTEYNGFKIDIDIHDRVFEVGQEVVIFYVFRTAREAVVVRMDEENYGWVIVRDSVGGEYMAAVGMVAPKNNRGRMVA